MMMKTKQKIKQTILSILLPTLLLCGCEDPYPAEMNPVQGLRLSLLMEDARTKVNADSQSGFCTWTDPASGRTDSIALWLSGTGANKYIDTLGVRELTNSGQAGSVICPSGNGQTRSFYAVYPSTAIDNSYYGNPELRVLYETDYDLSGRSAASLETYTRAPMVALNDQSTSSLEFYHVGGVLRIKMENLPVGTTGATVTFQGKNVTGTYQVMNISPAPTLSTETAAAAVAGDPKVGNTVRFRNFPATTAADNVRWLNVPLPCGDYSMLSGVTVGVTGGTASSLTKAAHWSTITHGQGKKLTCDFSGGTGALQLVDLGATSALTVWKGVSVSREARAYDADLTEIPAATASIVWTSTNPDVATVASDGTVTTKAAGETVIRATATDPANASNTKSAEYTLYVNEITSITLNKTSMIGRVGKSRRIKAEVTYTRNGNWSVPELSWRSTNTSIATVDMASTLPGEAKTVQFVAVTSASTPAVAIVAEIKSGSTVVASAQSTISVVSAAYVPGKFTVSAGKSVWFASGNVLFIGNYGTDKAGQSPGVAPLEGDVNRIWKFADNQWDYYTQMTISADGTAVIDHFGWATPGTTAADETTSRFRPWQWQNTSTGNSNNEFGYGPYSLSSSWTKNDNLPYGVVPGNTWVDRSVHASCDWGVHFNDAGEGLHSRTEGKWYTLSVYEWDYVFSRRLHHDQLRGQGSIYVDGIYINGTILLPDNWVCPEDCSFVPDYGFSSNVYAVGSAKGRHGQWEDMDAAGAVFLPAAGSRYGSDFGNSGDSRGYYWSSSAFISYNGNLAYGLGFLSGSVGPQSYPDRCSGLSVRLVHD